eukprot:g14237.t1
MSHEVWKAGLYPSLADDSIKISFEGTAGQSFGAWLATGVTLSLEGEANDYVGKGMCVVSSTFARRRLLPLFRRITSSWEMCACTEPLLAPSSRVARLESASLCAIAVHMLLSKEWASTVVNI